MSAIPICNYLQPHQILNEYTFAQKNRPCTTSLLRKTITHPRNQFHAHRSASSYLPILPQTCSQEHGSLSHKGVCSKEQTPSCLLLPPLKICLKLNIPITHLRLIEILYLSFHLFRVN